MGNLFKRTRARARHKDPATSKAAAASMTGGRGGGRGGGGRGDTPLSELLTKVLLALYVRPMTAEEVSDYLKIDKQSVTPRLVQLVERDFVYDTGRTSKNRSGRSAIVWKLTDAGAFAARGIKS